MFFDHSLPHPRACAIVHKLKKGLRIASRRPSADKGAPPPELFWSKIVAAALLSRERGTSKLTGTSWFLCLMIAITTAIWMMGIAVTAIVGKYYVVDVQPRLEYQIISGIVWWGVNPSFLTVWAIWLLSFALGAAACENEIRETKRAVLETDPSDGSGKWEQEVVCSLQRLRWRYLKRLHNGWETALTTFVVTLVAASLLALIFFINGSLNQNNATHRGGGLFLLGSYKSDLTIQNSTVDNNVPNGLVARHGSAIYKLPAPLDRYPT